jgi:hypothetical protein
LRCSVSARCTVVSYKTEQSFFRTFTMSSHQRRSPFATFLQERDLARQLKGPPLFVKQSSSTEKQKELQNQCDKRPVHIAHPLPNDVLFGRGRPLQSHRGNLRFHRIINKFREQYKNARKDEKVGTTETSDAITQQDSLILLY